MLKLKSYYAALMGLMFAIFAPLANAAADTDIAAGVTTFTDSWGLIKAALISVGVFLIVFGLLKKLRRA